MYGLETMPLTEGQKEELEVANLEMLRFVSGVTKNGNKYISVY